MASYRAVNSVLLALESFFESRLPADFSDGPINARVELWGSQDITGNITGNVLGIYLHRIEIDPHGRARFFAPTGTSKSAQADGELPINLHLLLVASATSATIEANLMAWAMVELANNSQLDISHLSDNDNEWTEREVLTVTPAEMNTENLMRIWEAFDNPYTASVPYVAKTIRLRLKAEESIGPSVSTRVFPAGRAVTAEPEA